MAFKRSRVRFPSGPPNKTIKTRFFSEAGFFVLFGSILLPVTINELYQNDIEPVGSVSRLHAASPSLRASRLQSLPPGHLATTESMYEAPFAPNPVSPRKLSVYLSAAIKVRPSSVTRMLQKLHEAGFIAYEKYRNITLTDKGLVYGRFLVWRDETLKSF
jgi:hypothetical protein